MQVKCSEYFSDRLGAGSRTSLATVNSWSDARMTLATYFNTVEQLFYFELFPNVWAPPSVPDWLCRWKLLGCYNNSGAVAQLIHCSTNHKWTYRIGQHLYRLHLWIQSTSFAFSFCICNFNSVCILCHTKLEEKSLLGTQKKLMVNVIQNVGCGLFRWK